MDSTNATLCYLGWFALTYMWLNVNCVFFRAILDAIYQHNAQIRRETRLELLRENDKDESGGESEYESADKSEYESEDEG